MNVKSKPEDLTLSDDEFEKLLDLNKSRLVNCLEKAGLKWLVIAECNDTDVLKGLAPRLAMGSTCLAIAISNEITRCNNLWGPKPVPDMEKAS